MSMTTTIATTEVAEPGPMPPHLRRVLAGLDGMIAQAEASRARWAATGDERSIAYVALADALRWMDERKLTRGPALRDSVAAVSCGIYRGTPVLDLDYLEDVEAHTDANFVMTGSGKFVEIQGTAEGAPFDRSELEALMTLAEKGIGELSVMQKTALGA